MRPLVEERIGPLLPILVVWLPNLPGATELTFLPEGNPFVLVRACPLVPTVVLRPPLTFLPKSTPLRPLKGERMGPLLPTFLVPLPNLLIELTFVPEGTLLVPLRIGPLMLLTRLLRPPNLLGAIKLNFLRKSTPFLPLEGERIGPLLPTLLLRLRNLVTELTFFPKGNLLIPVQTGPLVRLLNLPGMIGLTFVPIVTPLVRILFLLLNRQIPGKPLIILFFLLHWPTLLPYMGTAHEQ